MVDINTSSTRASVPSAKAFTGCCICALVLVVALLPGAPSAPGSHPPSSYEDSMTFRAGQ